MTFDASVSSTMMDDLPTSPPLRRLSVIYNPTAGGAKGRRFWRTVEALRANGCQVTLQETTQRGDAERLATTCDPSAHDALVIAGGDGTVNEAINGLLSRPAHDRVPLGIIPLGTANVLALDMGQSLKPQVIAHTLAKGFARPVHLAEVSFASGRDTPPESTPQIAKPALRHFLLMGGAGFDAHVVDHVRLGLKRRAGKVAYVVETLIQALRYPFPSVTGSIDGHPFEAATAVVCNGRLYGGPFVAAPNALLTDPELYVILLQRKGLWNVLRYAAALGRGRLGLLPDVSIQSFATLRLETPLSAPFQADGDVVGPLPLTVRQTAETIDLLWPTNGKPY